MVGPGCGGVGGTGLFVSPPRFNTVGIIRVDGGTPNSIGQLFFSLPPVASIPLGGCCGVYVDVLFGTLNPLLVVTTDAAGDWSQPIFYPSVPALTGLSFSLQAVIFGGSGIPGLDLSGGAVITLGS